MVTKKINEYIVAKGISMYAFENSLGVSRGSISKAVKENKSIGSQVLENILNVYSDLNPDWLLTGRGSMLRDNKNSEETKLSSMPITTPVLPAEESVIYRMYKDEKADWKAEKEKKESQIDHLQSELRSKSEELAVLKAKYQHPDEVAFAFTPGSPEAYTESCSRTKKDTVSSGRLLGGKM